MAFLVDTNVIIYRHDARYPEKKAIAERLLRGGLESREARIPHQVIVEFVSVATRPLATGVPLFSAPEARRQAESYLNQFAILWPNDALVRLALRGAAAYQLPWFDAHLWAYAELNGIATLYSEDFQHDRTYGSVRVVNPFVEGPGA